MSFNLEFSACDRIPEIKIFKYSKFDDNRGFIWTTFDKNMKGFFENQQIEFVHDKFAVNKKHVIRGIHGDNKSWKLVTVVYGNVFQVVIDCREKSENYLKHSSFELSAEKPTSILIPPGFGNAFQCISETAIYHYKLAYTGNYNDADQQFTFKWNDERIGITWPNLKPILSQRDR
jgi:dTDP-4-dehydrorhamnose 3,5-epimerase